MTKEQKEIKNTKEEKGVKVKKVEKKTNVKQQLHPRNKHQGKYDFDLLKANFPELAPYVKINKYKVETINFFNPVAVKTLNQSLLKQYYGVQNWDIAEGYLCPPVPGRADYIHYIADLLGEDHKGKIPKGKKVKCLDIGVGANCVYPILGNSEYGWSFTGSEIDPNALKSAANIIKANPPLDKRVQLRLQKESTSFFKGIIRKEERFDVTICNPPFHASLAAAKSGTMRKLKNLKSKNIKELTLNFGGQNQELWCKGGEIKFLKEMIAESKDYAKSCGWFTTLVSKESNLDRVQRAIKKVKAKEVKIIPMGQGNKKSRIVAWRF